MNQLTTINNGQVVVSSRLIAEHFEKEHGKVIRAIEDHIENLNKVGSPKVASQMFISSVYEIEGRNILNTC